MDYIYYLYYAADLLDLAKNYMVQYSQIILTSLLVIALLNCFFGFHLRKLWGILAGFIIGAAVAAGACIYIGKTGPILYLVTILGAFTFGLLALLLYKVGLFFIGSLTVPLLLSRVFPTEELETLLFWIFLGLLVGILTMVWERESVSLITAIGGGFGAAKCLLLLRNHNSLMMLFLIGVTLSMIGILLQFQPWRPRSAWNSDEERARDKQRHNRRMKRIRRKKKRQERIDQRKDAKNTASASRHSRGNSGPLFRRNSHGPETSEYTPYTAHPLYQATLSRKRLEDEYPAGESDHMPAPAGNQTPRTGTGHMHHMSMDYVDHTARNTSGQMPQAYGAASEFSGRYTDSDFSSRIAAQDPEAYVATPDLSEIRQSISQEVSDIYADRQQYMDASLNQLLEREFLHANSAINGTTGSSSED